MPYYPTLAEDVARAKEMLSKGFIAGGDVYAAQKLMESFIEVIEAVDVRVCELAFRHRAKLAAVRAAVNAELDLHGIPAALPDEDGPTTRPDYLAIPRIDIRRPDDVVFTCPTCNVVRATLAPEGAKLFTKEGPVRCAKCGSTLVANPRSGECVCRTAGCGHVASEHDGHGGCKLCQRLNCWS